MKINLILSFLSLLIVAPSFSQNAKDINTVIQKTIDLYALKDIYTEAEESGATPLYIMRNEQLPPHLIIFKFNNEVEIRDSSNIESNSYFVFEKLAFGSNEVAIKATFRKEKKVFLDLAMRKEGDKWYVTKSVVN